MKTIISTLLKIAETKIFAIGCLIVDIIMTVCQTKNIYDDLLYTISRNGISGITLAEVVNILILVIFVTRSVTGFKNLYEK